MSDDPESRLASQPDPLEDAADLERAAEEARKAAESSGEPEGEQGKQPHESPEDHAERSRLGRKVAEQERILGEMAGKLNQVVDIIQMFAQQAAQANQPNNKSQPEIPEWIPTEGKEFVPFAESLIENVLNKKMTGEQEKAIQFAHNYVAHINAMSADEDDPALVAEIVKLTTKPGEEFNVKYSDNPIADASRNYNRAKKKILSAQLPKGKENPLKGGAPETPLGGAPSSTVKKDAPTMQLSAQARRAAAAWGHSGKELEEMMRE